MLTLSNQAMTVATASFRGASLVTFESGGSPRYVRVALQSASPAHPLDPKFTRIAKMGKLATSLHSDSFYVARNQFDTILG